jgi:hypothetical protein
VVSIVGDEDGAFGLIEGLEVEGMRELVLGMMEGFFGLIVGLNEAFCAVRC